MKNFDLVKKLIDQIVSDSKFFADNDLNVTINDDTLKRKLFGLIDASDDFIIFQICNMFVDRLEIGKIDDSEYYQALTFDFCKCEYDLTDEEVRSCVEEFRQNNTHVCI